MLFKQYKINLLRQNLTHHEKAGDINMSNFKIYSVIKKKSGTLGRITAVRHLEINRISKIIGLKNAISIDRDIKWAWKMWIFLLTVLYCHKNIHDHH